MMRTILIYFAIGVAAVVGYTFGAKAGHRRYREIRAAAVAAWNDPRVKKARKGAVKEFNKQTKKIGR